MNQNIKIDPYGFREYDARWLYEKDISKEGITNLGKGLGTQIKKHTQKENPRVIVGHDYRSYSEEIKSALKKGLISTGCYIEDIGLSLSPMVYFAQFNLNADAVAMVTASHNENGWTGVKMGIKKGLTHTGDEMRELKDITLNEKFSNGEGNEKLIENFQQVYKDDLINGNKINKKLKAVVACGNGTAGVFAPDILRGIGCEVIELDCNLDWTFPKYNPNPEDLEMLHAIAKAVKDNNADIGFGFDGDGDRLIMVDHKGQKVDGDELVFIIANAWKESGDLKSNKVVGTKMTNLGIQLAFAEIGVSFIEADVGDRHVMDQLIEHKAVLGGEGSGHIICLNKSASGDGIIAALQVLEVMSKTGKTLLELKSKMTKYPQVLINVKTDTKVNLQEESKLSQAINSVESKLSKTGRVLVRESGTEPLVRVMVESSNYGLAKESAEELAKIIKSM